MRALIFFAVMVGLTGATWLFQRARQRQQKRELKDLAAEWGVRFTPGDPFHLAERLVRDFPIPGAADLRVLDVIYATQGDRHRYVFTVEYTRGVVEHHRREARAMTFCEPREGAVSAGAHGCPNLIAGPERL